MKKLFSILLLNLIIYCTKANPISIADNRSISNISFDLNYFKNKKNLEWCKQNFKKCNPFRIKQKLNGIELYAKDKYFLGNYNIICFDSKDNIIKIYNKVKTQDLKQPLGVHDLENKVMEELKPEEKSIKNQLNIQISLRKNNIEIDSSLNVVDNETSYILIEKDGIYYLQNIEKINGPELFKFSLSPDNSKLIIEWKKVPEALGYEVELICSNENEKDDEIRKEKIANHTLLNISILPKFNRFFLKKLVAYSSNCESENFQNFQNLDTSIEIISLEKSLIRKNFDKFLKKYEVKLNEELIKELLEKNSIIRNFSEDEENFEKLNFIKYLILNLDKDFKKMGILNIENYLSGRVDKVIQNNISPIHETNEDIFNSYVIKVKELYKNLKNGNVKLFKNYEDVEVKDYNIEKYISNFMIALAISLNENLLQVNKTLNDFGINDNDIKATSYIAPTMQFYVNEDILRYSLLNEKNKVSISYYIKRISNLLKNSSVNLKERDESLIIMIECFTHCISGIYERLALVYNKLNKIVNNNSFTPLEEIVEFNLLNSREKIFTDLTIKLTGKTSLNNDGNKENIMYLESLRKDFHSALKINPPVSDKNSIIRDNDKIWNISFEDHLKFISDFNEEYKNETYSSIQMDINKYKEISLPLLKLFLINKFSSYMEDVDYLAHLFYRNYIKDDNQVNENFIKALFLEMGVAKIILD